MPTESVKTNAAVFGAGAKLVRPRQAKVSNSVGVSGIDLMRKINDGLERVAPSAEIAEVRTEITKNCEEIIEQGARIRPLFAEKTQVGWVRGLHVSERRLITRWIFDPNEFLAAVIKTCTSFNKEEVDNLSSFEVRRLSELIVKMSEYDLSLFPYLSAYATTSSSENLWFSKGTHLTAYEQRTVQLPDGRAMNLLAPPEHAKLWATLCNYREAAKARLDANFNALMILQGWVGKSADPIRSDLKSAQRSMMVDAQEPWEQIIRVRKEQTLDDGWAHSMEDSSVEGLQRELRGMFEGDKHERFMEKFYKQQQDKAEAEKSRIEAIVAKRGGPGVTSEITGVYTEAESRQRERDLKKGRPVPIPAKRDEGTVKPEDKILKYR